MRSWLNNVVLAALAGGVLFFVNQTAEAQYVVYRPAYAAPYYGPTIAAYPRPLFPLIPRRVVAYPVAPVVVGYPSVPVVSPTVVNYAPSYAPAYSPTVVNYAPAPVAGPTVVNYAPSYTPTVVNYPSTISTPTVVRYPGTTVYYGNSVAAPAVVYPLPSVVYPPSVFP